MLFVASAHPPLWLSSPIAQCDCAAIIIVVAVLRCFARFSPVVLHLDAETFPVHRRLGSFFWQARYSTREAQRLSSHWTDGIVGRIPRPTTFPAEALHVFATARGNQNHLLATTLHAMVIEGAAWKPTEFLFLLLVYFYFPVQVCCNITHQLIWSITHIREGDGAQEGP